MQVLRSGRGLHSIQLISRHASTSAMTAEAATKAAAQQLLPPLQLYRRLLRIHRKVLPPELRLMGDDYVKAEFRRTKTTDNPLQIVGFLTEWKKYLDHHENMLPLSPEDREKLQGQKLNPSVMERMSADQIGQLYELLQATREIWSPTAAATNEGAAAAESGSEHVQSVESIQRQTQDLPTNKNSKK